MYLTACQVPDEPCIDGTEEQIAACCQFLCFGNILQDPADFRSREISINEEPCFFSDFICPAGFLQGIAVGGGSSALPYDGVMYGLAVSFIPEDGGFSLVGDADAGNIFCGDAQLFNGTTGNFQLRIPDFHGVMFHPAGVGVILLELLLGGTQHFAVFVK